MGHVRVEQQRRKPHATSASVRQWSWVVLGLAVIVGSDRAWAQSGGNERVLVLALVDSGVGAEATRRISSVLRSEVAAVVGPGYVEATGALATERCPLEGLAACAAAKGKGVRADLVVVGTVAALADAQLVDLRIIDAASAAETGRLQSPLGSTPEENRRVLRELSVRLLAPQAYVGTLVVENLVEGDHLLVDGAEVATEVPTARVALPVGQHAIEVVQGEESRLTDVIDVGFEQVNTARVGGPEKEPVAHAEPAVAPGWPFWAAAAIGGVAAATSLALVATFLATDAMGNLEAAEDNRAQREREDGACLVPAGRDRDVDPLYYCNEQIQGLQTLIALELGGAGVAGLLALGSGVAAVLLYPAGSEAAEAVAHAP